MNTKLTTIAKPSALMVMADRCSVDPDRLHSTLKNTVFKGATDDELLALVVTANTYELNPLLKELYAFPKKGGGITPMVGVDGWLKIANRQPNFDGMDVVVYGDGKTPTHATCEIFLKDRTHSVKITEYFEECKRNTDPWNQMPRRMLRNKAIIQAIRVAFGIGGIHDEDEAEDIGMREPRNVTPRAVVRENPVSPFDAIADPQPEPKPAPEPAAVEVAPNPETVPPQGRQQKPRHKRDGKFLGIERAEANGKTWWNVTVGIAGKMPTFTTFSVTLSDALYELEKGTPIQITAVANADGSYSLEDFVLIENTQPEGALV
jgi:phage recombination protein Bet